MKGACLFLLSLVSLNGLSGCTASQQAPAEYDVRAGDSAPEYGSSEAMKSYGQFIVGHWAMTDYVDPEFAKQLGIGALSKEMADQPVSDVFTFGQDGTFEYRRLKSDWKVSGHWKDDGAGLTLSFETYNGKPLQQAVQESKKAAEGGTQAAVAKDLFMDSLMSDVQKLTTLRLASNKRMLVFTSPDGGPVQSAAGTALERLVQSDNQ